MQQNKMNEILSKSFTTLKALYDTYYLCSNLKTVEKKMGVEAKDVLEIIVRKYLSAIDDSVSDTLKYNSQDNKTAIYYAYKYDLAKQMLDQASNDIKNKTMTRPYILMLGCRLGIYYLYQSLDSITNVFTHAYYIIEKDSIKKTVIKFNAPEEIEGILLKIEDFAQVDNTVVNFFKSKNISENDLVNLYKNYHKFDIGYEDAFKDTQIYSDFCSILPATVQADLGPYMAVLTRCDIASLLASYRTSGTVDDDFIQDLESRIETRSESISLYPDYEQMYDTLTKDKSVELRAVDLTTLPFDIVAEALVLQQVTPALIEAMNKPLFTLPETEEF